MHHSSGRVPPHRILNRQVPFHALRAAMVASAVVGLAAGAHVIGGGALPALPILLAIVTLTGLAATTATRFKLDAPAVFAVLGIGQLLLHEALTALSTAPLASPKPTVIHAGHGRQDHGEVLAALAAVGHPAAAQDHGVAGMGMLLAHTAATLACAALLSRGEAALWALAAWLRPLVHLPEALAFDAGHSPAVADSPPLSVHRPWRNLRQDSRRGPPSAVAFS